MSGPVPGIPRQESLVRIRGIDRARPGAATYVTGNYFRVLGLRPTLGAGLQTDANDAESAPPLIAVTSHVLWQRHFSARRTSSAA